MEFFNSVSSLNSASISCVEMHTSGEPTRIVTRGFPGLHGTLLEQRTEAKTKYDHLRRRIILEPRGHVDMYGAILRPTTELTTKGKADMGVLFIHNEGYSTMCGHATIALGRFLIDTHDPEIFPSRKDIELDPQTRIARLKIHAPCGLLDVTVPTTADGQRSDPTRPVSFVSVPSFASAVDTDFEIPREYLWPELQGRNKVRASIAYGGAFYCLITPEELGFSFDVLRNKPDIQSLDNATRNLKAAISTNQSCDEFFWHPDSEELAFLYGIMIVDKGAGIQAEGTTGAETGLCFFADQEVDRSPTGSAVAARVALAYRRGDMEVGHSWTYHSLISNAWRGNGGFVGKVLKGGWVTVAEGTASQTSQLQTLVQVKGYAYYTGAYQFVVEQDDPLGDDGFVLEHLERKE